MNYNRFIEKSPKVSEIGLGAWQLGESSDWQSLSEKEAIDLTLQAYDLGVNFFDTAPNYGLGTSELRLGKAFKHLDRDKLVINTKFGHTVEGGINWQSDHIRESIEGSLKRLNTDYVDSLIFHNPPIEYFDGNKNDHYEILERLVEQGKIRAYGASVDTYDEMKLLIETTNSKVVEAFFNILHQDVRRAFDLAMDKGVGIIAKIPLDSGWLSGKYNADSTFTDIRSRWSQDDKETRAKLVGKIKTLIPQEMELYHAAISYCLAYDAVSTVIPGNKSIDQLKNNLACVNNPISEETVKKLEEFFKKDVKPLNLPW
jgi:aryl-alcohol dehydrogenase-like predicted oxidoreductase